LTTLLRGAFKKAPSRLDAIDAASPL